MKSFVLARDGNIRLFVSRILRLLSVIIFLFFFFFFLEEYSGIFNIELGELITGTWASFCLSLEFLIEIFQFQEIR